MRYSSQVKPISYLKANAAEVLTLLAEQREPLVITQNGEAKAVLQDVASFEETQETLALLKILAEMGPDGSKKVRLGQKVIERVRADFGALAKSGKSPKASEAALKKCFDTAFKNAAASAATSSTELDQAAGVRDEATKPYAAPAPATATDAGAPAK